MLPRFSRIRGSSPLTRGGLSGVLRFPLLRGLIPAYAGRTARSICIVLGIWAHPRLRGADRRAASYSIPARGSSPLTRGGPTADAVGALSSRLIPAYAGRTHSWAFLCAAPEAHPRLRGADRPLSRPGRGTVGSSPLTRGGLVDALNVLAPAWLIPAYAGRTPEPDSRPESDRAHPRLRGADSASDVYQLGVYGSSPLTRGGPEPCRGGVANGGLIPAYAGRTRAMPGRSCQWWAHPRLRGADSAFHLPTPGLDGSSPLTRGGLIAGAWRPSSVGLIPAYAGRTRGARQLQRFRKAHPRLRGADRAKARSVLLSSGSSPLTRGGRGTATHLLAEYGLIPAYAGRTRPRARRRR